MTWRILPAAAFVEMRADWQRLAAQYHAEHPLLDARFIGECLVRFGDRRNRLAVEESGGTVQSMLVLDNVSGWSCTSFNPSQLPICPFVTSLRELGASLRDLVKVRPLSALLGLMRYDPKYYGPVDGVEVERLPCATTMEIAVTGAFQDYWSARHKKLRDNMRRYLRRAQSAGHEVRLEAHVRPATMADAVRRYGEVESRGWKGQEGTAVEITNVQGVFYSNVLTSMAETGNACALELWFGDVLVASRLLIASGGIVVFLKTTYREDYSEFAAGRLLLHSALEWLFDTPGARCIEFYTNATADQLQWSTASRPIEHLNAFRSPSIAKMAGLRRSWQRLRKATPPADQDHM